MPIVLFITMILMFFGVYIYQQSMLHQMASVTAERSAYSWDNSHKDAVSGQYAKGQYDSLYWRVTDDHLLGTLFGWAVSTNQELVALPTSIGESGSLSSSKLRGSASVVTGSIEGSMTYKNSVIQRNIIVNLNKGISLPIFQTKDDARLVTQSKALVVDPVEFIRNIDLMRYYGSKFKGDGGNTTDQASASSILRKNVPTKK
ncbi:hypothetical protein JCM16418A_02650 [Paenibacillus pini]|uniref:Uncharacterized protein n=2 Tax=Paenibacillus TaxID=44249 RepID=W7Z1G9_9BACL|nr:hypothetical protein JCM16418_2250 [Paenibacillus pini JCM 16418]